MFENTHLYRMNWQKRYLGTVSGYLTIFNFIYTTGPQFNENCMMIFSGNYFSQIVHKISLRYINGYFFFLILAQTFIKISLNMSYTYCTLYFCPALSEEEDGESKYFQQNAML